ncbi:hypothetical protein ACTVZO_41455 [Streptomyces sp. IBSNAI002]|uniref:hypothetical protein n=1 Tax=Streptomyces sp. IBSNAI002 TaxID=3457500 RepID=UPI003FD17D2C
MVPEVRQPGSLAAYLRQHLNLTPEFQVGGLDVERIANIAMLAMAHSEEYSANAHLVSLVGGLPLPSDEPHDFWFKLWQASGNPIFLPGNIRHQVLRSLQGDGKALADQLITALSEMSAPQRKAASTVIGEALEEAGMWGSSPDWLGDLWLQDVERTSWRILYARRENAENSLEAQEQFRAGWKNA